MEEGGVRMGLSGIHERPRRLLCSPKAARKIHRIPTLRAVLLQRAHLEPTRLLMVSRETRWEEK